MRITVLGELYVALQMLPVASGGFAQLIPPMLLVMLPLPVTLTVSVMVKMLKTGVTVSF